MQQQQPPRFNSYPSSSSSQFPNQLQIPNNNNMTTAPPVNAQGFSTNPSLANLCNMLQNSMPMQMQMQQHQQHQQQPQLGFIMNPQFQVPFNNNPNTLMPNISPFINQLGLPQMGFSPQNFLNNMNNVPMFLNQLNSSQLQLQPQQQFPFNFSNFPQHLNQNMTFPPNLQNPNMNPIFPNLSQHVAPPNPNCFPIGQQVNGTTSSMSQTQNWRHCDSVKQQGNPVSNGQNSTSSSKWKKFPNKDFRKNPKQEPSNMRYQKSQFHPLNNGKRKFGEHKGKGNSSERAAKSGRTTPTEQARETKRSLALIYTEQEIKQWREERRINFPSKANREKKCSKRLMNSGGIDKEAKLRREQLKEILAKQAELGVEVAEIPSHYLSDSEKQVKEKEDNRISTPKKGKYRSKRDRRGRYNKDRLAKQNTLANKDSSNVSPFSRKKPTLLQKLLSTDIRKDKHHLLQIFRFMVMNSFFEDWPEKPLKFPSVVVVKEDEVVAEKSLISGKGDPEVSTKTAVENCGHVSDNDDDGDNRGVRVEQGTSHTKGKRCNLDNRTEEEEGEIIN